MSKNQAFVIECQYFLQYLWLEITVISNAIIIPIASLINSGTNYLH